jgi:glycosyltransferase involved in cell wall biosynthesis
MICDININDMYTNVKIGAVIPAYRVSELINNLLLAIPPYIDHIFVVDDKCPDASGQEAEKVRDSRINIIYHGQNTGVGGAVVSGYKKALEAGCDIVIKIDGDGQMDPKYIPDLLAPLINDEADFAKGNRFMDFRALKKMPKVRLFGNSVLSFLVKIASGYWNIIDPTNGYTAVHRRCLEKLDLNRISRRYFFESDMLIHLNLINAVVTDISIPARYENEKSSLNITRIIFEFPPKLLGGLVKRIFLKYFIYDFNMASVYLLLGLPMFMFGTVFGVIEWIDSIFYGTAKTAGTIMLIALPIIVSFQMLLQAINIDIYSTPKRSR